MTRKQVRESLLRQFSTGLKVYPTTEAERLGVTYPTVHAVCLELRREGLIRDCGTYFGGYRRTEAYPIYIGTHRLKSQIASKTTTMLADEESARYHRMQDSFGGSFRAAY